VGTGTPVSFGSKHASDVVEEHEKVRLVMMHGHMISTVIITCKRIRATGETLDDEGTHNA
jgi:hypothetical protein